MNILANNIKWIMLVSGALTCTMFYAVLAPQAALQSVFGEALQGPVAEIVVRNWGALITLVGLMLIYGAFNSAARLLVLTVAAASKLIFIVLLIFYGGQFISRGAALPLAIDLLWVVLFALYLAGSREKATA